MYRVYNSNILRQSLIYFILSFSAIDLLYVTKEHLNICCRLLNSHYLLSLYETEVS